MNSTKMSKTKVEMERRIHQPAGTLHKTDIAGINSERDSFFGCEIARVTWNVVKGLQKFFNKYVNYWNASF